MSNRQHDDDPRRDPEYHSDMDEGIGGDREGNYGTSYRGSAYQGGNFSRDYGFYNQGRRRVDARSYGEGGPNPSQPDFRGGYNPRPGRNYGYAGESEGDESGHPEPRRTQGHPRYENGQWQRGNPDPRRYDPGGYGGYQGGGREAERSPYTEPDASHRRGQFTGHGPRGYRRSDERIMEDVCETLTRHGEVDAREIEIEVREGVVTLTGTVHDRRMKRTAEDAIEDIPGVQDIHNQLRVQPFNQSGQQNPT